MYVFSGRTHKPCLSEPCVCFVLKTLLSQVAGCFLSMLPALSLTHASCEKVRAGLSSCHVWTLVILCRHGPDMAAWQPSGRRGPRWHLSQNAAAACLACMLMLSCAAGQPSSDPLAGNTGSDGPHANLNVCASCLPASLTQRT